MKKKVNPPQEQDSQPGRQAEMHPQPIVDDPGYRGSGKLENKVALVTGGDSGIGRSVCVYFAREGADIAVVYLSEDEDAKETQRLVEREGRRCLLIRADLRSAKTCEDAVQRTLEEFGKLDTLVNNAAEQHQEDGIEDVCEDQLLSTFQTNVFAYLYLAKAAVPHMAPGSTIINTTSVVAYRGSPKLLSYSATKGAVVAFTRALSQDLVEQGIRVNAVAPGPIWTPFIPSTFPADKVAEFGSDQPMKRPGQPSEVAPAYVFLASNDSSYLAGQAIHPNGGEVING